MGGAASDAQPPNPIQSLLGAFLGGKGSDKGSELAATGSVPAATPSAPTAANIESNDGGAERAAFEESVTDLLNMGLVTDRQTARELLTQHGDISTVVAILAEPEL